MLGMAFERNAAIGNNALRERRRHHTGELAGEASLGRPPEALEKSCRVIRRWFSRLDLDGKRRVDRGKARVELATVSYDNNTLFEARANERIAELRSDAGGFAGRDYERFLLRHI